MGGDVFGFELDLFIEVGSTHDDGALPCELGDAVGLAFLDGGGEIEVDAGGGDLGCGVGEVYDCGVEIAVVAVDVGDQVADGSRGIQIEGFAGLFFDDTFELRLHGW